MNHRSQKSYFAPLVTTDQVLLITMLFLNGVEKTIRVALDGRIEENKHGAYLAEITETLSKSGMRFRFMMTNGAMTSFDSDQVAQISVMIVPLDPEFDA